MLMRKSHEQCALECFCRLVFLGNLEYPLVVLVVVHHLRPEAHFSTRQYYGELHKHL